MKIFRKDSSKLKKIINRSFSSNKNIVKKVSKILDDVRLSGDEALIKYTRKFDKVKLNVRDIKVSQGEISSAFQEIKPEFVSQLKIIFDNVTRFYKRQSKKVWRIKDEEGILLGEYKKPLDSVGIYIPSGTAPLISSVYMSVLPAKLAGVRRVVLMSPPNKSKTINPYILAVANLLKVTEIYKIGGAQAIAAMAFGTKSIPRVDKIIGPGNIYVTEAKRQVFGFADIDMLAGPTELVIIANKFSNPDFIKADVKAQTEHLQGLAIVITTCKKLARVLAQEEVKNSFIVTVKNLKEAVDLANDIAAEHLEIMVNNPRALLKNVKNAGAVFLGQYSPVAIGDYVAGPSHILPTMGTARFFSGLTLDDFMKSTHVVSYSKKALDKCKKPLETVANLEGLVKHLESVKIRF